MTFLRRSPGLEARGDVSTCGTSVRPRCSGRTGWVCGCPSPERPNGRSVGQMSRDLDLVPDPNEVASLVEGLVGSEWPTSEAQRLSWFNHHELDVRESRRGWGDNGSDNFVGTGPERWGGPRFGWHTFEGDFVGVSWFLWHGAPPEAVRMASRQLREGLCGFAGPPVEEISRDNDPDNFTAFWEVQGRTIDMYLHGGLLPDGSSQPDSVVQLHVDHTARSQRADKAADRAEDPPSR